MQTKHICVLIHIWTKGQVCALWNWFKPSSKIFLPTVPRQCFFCGLFFMSCRCRSFASVNWCLVATWRKRAGLLALVCDVYCHAVAFLFGRTSVVLDWIVSCCLSYFESEELTHTNKCMWKNQLRFYNRGKWKKYETCAIVPRSHIFLHSML